VLNLPNVLTISRLVLAVVLFVLLATDCLKTGLVLFIVAASTDWLDGYLARRRGETTRLGRILDPFVDKVIVLGAFIFLLPIPGSAVTAWMVTVVVARELLVTGLRSYLEGESVAFGADWAGKIKMVVQCVAIGVVLFYLGVLRSPLAAGWYMWGSPPEQWGAVVRTVCVWAAVGITALSGMSYAWRAARLIRERE
jgi:CDP-diacylglycerol--glycerol-3-phosphate 3-phosphatidyltransferase